MEIDVTEKREAVKAYLDTHGETAVVGDMGFKLAYDVKGDAAILTYKRVEGEEPERRDILITCECVAVDMVVGGALPPETIDQALLLDTRTLLEDSSAAGTK